jgi:hypothetical protein
VEASTNPTKKDDKDKAKELSENKAGWQAKQVMVYL